MVAQKLPNLDKKKKKKKKKKHEKTTLLALIQRAILQILVTIGAISPASKNDIIF